MDLISLILIPMLLFSYSFLIAKEGYKFKHLPSNCSLVEVNPNYYYYYYYHYYYYCYY